MFGRKRKDPEPVEDAEALYQQGKILRQRFDTRSEAEVVLGRAATLGHKVAMFDLAVLLEQQHRPDEARAWFERAQAAGHILAGKKLASLDEDDAQVQRHRDELAPLLQEAEYGDAEAMFDYAWGLRTRFPLEDSLSWFERSAKAGHRPAFRELASLCAHSDPARAEQMLRLDAEHDDVEGVRGLADFLRTRDRAAAVPVLERLHELGGEDAAHLLGSLHWQEGRLAEAERWFRVAMEAASDDEEADDHAGTVGALLVEQGRGEEEGTEELLRRGLAGELHLAWLLEARGDDAGAEPLYSAIVETDNHGYEAMAGLARILERRGNEAHDVELYRDEVLTAGFSMELPDFLTRR